MLLLCPALTRPQHTSPHTPLHPGRYLSQYEELYELLALQEEARLTQVRQMSSGMWSAFELALTVLGGYGRPYTKRARAITVSNIQHLSEVTNPVPIQPCQ